MHLIEYEKEYEESFKVFAREKGFINHLGATEKIISEAFWEIHNNANNIHKLFQYFCFVLYAIGVVLIGFVIIQNIITVGAYL